MPYYHVHDNMALRYVKENQVLFIKSPVGWINRDIELSNGRTKQYVEQNHK